MTTIPAETITQQRQTLNLNLGALKTVTWLETNPVVDDVTKFSKRQCDKAKEYTVVGWIFAVIQFQLLWLYTLLHTIPWPSWVIGGVHRVDDAVEWALETAFRKLEWWWDYISVHLMRAVETSIVYLDKLITFIDHTIDWLLHKYHWAWEMATTVLLAALKIWNWYVGVWTTALGYIMSLVRSVQSAWEGSQEEMLTIQEQQQKKQLNDRQQQHQQRQRRQQQIQQEQHLGLQGGTGLLLSPQQPFAVLTEDQECCYRGSGEGSVVGWGSGGEVTTQHMSKHFSSDSESSDVTGVHETSTLLVGERTGRSYKRVHTEATVIGQKRQAMYHRVSAKLKVMRKNSIRFSRGMDVRVSQLIGSAQKKFTPRSLVSLLLSLIKFLILAPLRVGMWLVGGKRLSRRSRSVRSESIRRREAAAAAAAAECLLTRPLGPAALLQSAEPAYELHEKTVLTKIKDPESYLDSIRQDSGVSEGVPDSSEESNGANQSAVATIRKMMTPTVSYQSRQEKCLSMSSTSTISEEPDEDVHISNSPTPPPTPRDPSPSRGSPRDTTIPVAAQAVATSPGLLSRRRQHTLVSDAVELVSSPTLATSEPDLRQTSILVNGNHSSPDYKRRSIGATLDEYSQSQGKKPKKRVTIQ